MFFLQLLFACIFTIHFLNYILHLSRFQASKIHPRGDDTSFIYLAVGFFFYRSFSMFFYLSGWFVSIVRPVYLFVFLSFVSIRRSSLILFTAIIEDIQDFFQIEDAFWGCGHRPFK